MIYLSLFKFDAPKSWQHHSVFHPHVCAHIFCISAVFGLFVAKMLIFPITVSCFYQTNESCGNFIEAATEQSPPQTFYQVLNKHMVVITRESTKGVMWFINECDRVSWRCSPRKCRKMGGGGLNEFYNSQCDSVLLQPVIMPYFNAVKSFS